MLYFPGPGCDTSHLVTEGTGPVLENPKLGRDAENTGQRGLWGKKEQLWDHTSHDRLASFSGHLYLRTPSFQRLHPETSEPESSPHSSLSVPPQPQSGNKSCGLPLQNRSRNRLLVDISASTIVALTITASHCVLADASSRSPSYSLASYRHFPRGPRLSPVPPLLSLERIMTFHLLRVKAYDITSSYGLNAGVPPNPYVEPLPSNRTVSLGND